MGAAGPYRGGPDDAGAGAGQPGPACPLAPGAPDLGPTLRHLRADRRPVRAGAGADGRGEPVRAGRLHGLGISLDRSTGRGIWLARAGDYDAHRRWMLRSRTLTFGAVTLRIIMGPLMAMGWTGAQTYDVTAWGAWVPSLILLEIWQSRGPRWPASDTGPALRSKCQGLPRGSPLSFRLERAKGFEPSTLTLARLCSTPELRPHSVRLGGI